MGFKEIAMIVVSLILGGILALNVAPSISASGDATKTSVVNSEFESVTSAARMWMANISTTGTFTGITAQAMSANIPNLVLNGTGATSKLESKVLSTITYGVAAGGTGDNSVVITISGLSGVTGAEASLATSLIAKYGTESVTNTTADDGIIVVTVRG
jgi:hypothetical protein